MTTFDNDSLKNELASEFIRRNDLVARWGMTISSFLAIPGLVGFWPMSSVQRSTGNVYDLSGQGRTLTYNGNPLFGIHNSVVPYINLDGTGDYLERADETDLDIIGTETIHTEKGLTMGGWFWHDTLGAIDGLMGKWNTTGNQRSYLLRSTTSTLTFYTSSDGTAETTVSSSTALTTGTWNFIVARYAPGSTISVYLNGSITSNTTSIPASLFNSTAAFQIGAFNAGAQVVDGRATLCFLSANRLSPTLISMLYYQSRTLFGV